MVKKVIEIQPEFEPGSSEFRSDALTNDLLELWQRIRWHLSIETVWFSGWISRGFEVLEYFLKHSSYTHEHT